MTDVKSRFWAKVERRGHDECWPWTAALDDQGYGSLRVAGKMKKAHRVAYELLVGPIPVGLDIDHTCHNSDDACLGGRCEHRSCVNPAHLEAVTHRVNVLRGKGEAARHAAAETCKNGHPFDGANVRQRVCLTCHREASRRYDAKRRARAA